MNISKILAVSLFGAAFATTVEAQEINASVGPFVDVSFGAAGVGLDDIGLAEKGDSDSDGTVGAVRGGYWFNENWGVSASYTELGTISQGFVGGNRLRGDSKSYGVSAMGRLPFADRWALVGKLGVSRASLKDNGSTLTATQINKFTGEKTGVSVGAELHYSLGERASVFVELSGRGSVSDKVSVGYSGVGLRVGF